MSERSIVDQHNTFSVRVCAGDTRGAQAYARATSFDCGPALIFDASDLRSSALEQLLGALGSDLALGIKAAFQRARLEVDSVELLVEARLENALVYLGVVGEQGEPRIEQIALRVFVETLEDETDISPVFEAALARSPIYCTLARACQIKTRLQVVM